MGVGGGGAVNTMCAPQLWLSYTCTWYTHGTHMVHTWYTHGTHMVHTWYTHGTHMVHTWYTHGTHMVHTHMAYTQGTHILYSAQVSNNTQDTLQDVHTHTYMYMYLREFTMNMLFIHDTS